MTESKAAKAAKRYLPKCKVCRHRDCGRIEAMCADTCFSHYDIAAEFHVSRYSVDRHWKNHVSPTRKAELIAGPAHIAKLARRAADEDRSLIDYLSILRRRERGFISDAASIAQRLLNTLDVIGKLTGQLRAGGIVINNHVASIGSTAPTIVLSDPAVIKLQATIIRALGPFPAARAAVIEALRGFLEPRSNGHDPTRLPVPAVIDVTPNEAANA